MNQKLEKIVKRAILITGLFLDGAAAYIAYYKGGSYFLKQEYAEAAKHFFIYSAIPGIPANILLVTAGALYGKDFFKKIKELKKYNIFNNNKKNLKNNNITDIINNQKPK